MTPPIALQFGFGGPGLDKWIEKYFFFAAGAIKFDDRTPKCIEAAGLRIEIVRSSLYLFLLWCRL